MPLRDFSFKPRYSTSRDDLSTSFFAPLLLRARTYDRAVGYFRSSLIDLCREPIAEFAARGNRIQLICSPELDPEDRAAIQLGYDRRDDFESLILNSLQSLIQDASSKPALEFLATLVAVRALEIKLAFRPGARGIFHDKVGVASDGTECVSFVGSANETAFAWDPKGNHESVEVFTSWSQDSGRVREHAAYFERLWRGVEPNVMTVDFPDVARTVLMPLANSAGVEAAFRSLEGAPRRRTLQRHQLEALDAWERRGRTGILTHATSSGKTLTAIRAIDNWIHVAGPAMIIVPSKDLLQQWDRELRMEVGEVTLQRLLVGAGNDLWRQPDVVEGFTRREGPPRVTIATVQTASTNEFRRRVLEGDHLMLVVDEVHRAGSPVHRKALVAAGARLGLSATANRAGDPAGTQVIDEYFRGAIESNFSIRDGIAVGRICPYRYFIHPVHLTEAEAHRWQSLTIEIARLLGGDEAMLDESVRARLELLMIQRAAVVKQAERKVPLAQEVLQAEYVSGHRWLVYCDSVSQLSQVVDAVRCAAVPAQPYYAEMPGDRAATLAHFGAVGGCLVAVRCLDEGVDIPDADHALVLASSRNPREFIQRRGRVLRSSPRKFSADIHDAIVLPPAGVVEPAGFSMLGSEIARAARFADDASNTAVRFRIRRIAQEYAVPLDEERAREGWEPNMMEDEGASSD